MVSELLFVVALPFVLTAAAYGFYILGRSLARLVPALWARLQQKGEGK